MKKLACISFALVTATLVGCSNSVPRCGDRDTTDLVKEIADREMANDLGREFANQFSYDVNAVRTTSTDEKTGAHECAAQLEIASSITGLSEEIPITYTVEMLDNGKEFYVNVWF